MGLRVHVPPASYGHKKLMGAIQSTAPKHFLTRKPVNIVTKESEGEKGRV